MFDENYQVYGAREIWWQLNREGITVARRTVEWLMAANGLSGMWPSPGGEGAKSLARRADRTPQPWRR